MAYDPVTAQRLRSYLSGEDGLSEKAMFGGLAFMINGQLAVAAGSHGGLMVRVDPAETDGLVQQPHVTRMVMRGRELDGWLRVEAEAITSEMELQTWADRGLRYVRSL